MPYSGPGDSKLPSHIKKLPGKKQGQWVHVWNSTFKKTGDEGKAFAAANSVVKKVLEGKGLIMDLWEVDSRQLGQDEAGYDAMGAKDGKGCGNCNFFIPGDDACLIVSGDIVATGISNFWYQREPYKPEPMPVTIVGGKSLAERIKRLVGFTVWSKVRPFAVVKDSNGRLRFFMTVSNNYKDKHKEIITEAAHKAYVVYADKSGKYPEAWLWHTEGTKWGQVDWLDYADGFLVASGLVDPGSESVALKLAEQDTAVSHGFFCVAEKGLITKYWSFEFSALPRKNAANEWTGYNLATEWEDCMGFSEDKKKWLIEMGVPEDKLKAVEDANQALGEKLKGMGVEFKEADFTETVQVMATLDKLTDAIVGLKGEVVGLGDRVGKAEKSVDDKVAEAFTARNGQEKGFSPANSAKTQASSSDPDVQAEKQKAALGWWSELVVDPLAKTTASGGGS